MASTAPTTSVTEIEPDHPVLDASPEVRRAYAGVLAIFLHARLSPTPAARRARRDLLRRLGLSVDEAADIDHAAGHDPDLLHPWLARIADVGLGVTLTRDLVRIAWTDGRYHPRERHLVRSYASLMLLDEASVACVEAELLPAHEEEEEEPEAQATGGWLRRVFGAGRPGGPGRG